MPDASAGPGPTDPHGLGAAVERLSSAGRAQGQAAFAIVSTRLEPGEAVQFAASCRFLGADGAVVVTDRRMLIANARQWEPDIVPVGLEAGLTVQGWQDERAAALVFGRDGHELVIDQIVDRDVAQQIAAEVRRRSEG